MVLRIYFEPDSADSDRRHNNLSRLGLQGCDEALHPIQQPMASELYASQRKPAKAL